MAKKRKFCGCYHDAEKSPGCRIINGQEMGREVVSPGFMPGQKEVKSPVMPL